MRKLLPIFAFIIAFATVSPAMADGFVLKFKTRDGSITLGFGGRDRSHDRYYGKSPRYDRYYDDRYDYGRYSNPRKKKLWGGGQRVYGGEFCPGSKIPKGIDENGVQVWMCY